ncbi:enoyl-CoA hydratase [Candidatus Lucifugimonas marina]|uniref:Enoyl-CoA hydratase n=1 Tax=Candidatus Lucifugimonas marina TaxID=3038979 RepID=A0AAJ6CR59_9CHLR|nr:enoyl-CoA hydratase [SAR202 cluster bacterium JH702]MDG0868352.1 enoyl-CoA hydratase [SAR202 cluster bacterium JH639]WFG34988.1 enoyl-CoA hydratase [SAR202 cluster bacterium JH545]WFG38946.1 enoyl-CoA hydratase [SAR202 cluster bacterium JH1073]
MRQLQLRTDKMQAYVEDGVGWITFNQPNKRNAVSLAMWEAVPEIIEDFISTGDVRVVVLKGAGDKAFVSGADISEFEEVRNTPKQIELYEAATGACHAALQSLEIPLIAMIRGFCIGGGMAIALSADLRITADDGQFGVPAAKLGLGYGYGGIKELMNIVGPSFAKEIFFTGGRFSASDAETMGLVNRVVPVGELEATVSTFAKTIADNAPMTVKAAKAAINEGTKNPDERDLDRVAEMVEACFNSEDYKEGRRAFMEKRKPQFQGR